MACLKHSDFLKVKGSAFTPHSQVQLQSLSICQNKTRCSPRGRTGLLQQKSNYELFNRNNFNIRYWSWNYRGCWHQTCPPIDTRSTHLSCAHSDRGSSMEKSASLSIVTTSAFRQWVIFAPAAFLGCGSNLSGSLSGIEP